MIKTNHKYSSYNNIILYYPISNIPTQFLTTDVVTKLNNIYGLSGDLTNTSISFSLTFIGATYINEVKKICYDTFNIIDKYSVISNFNIDSYQKDLSINIIISWSSSNTNAYQSATNILKNLSTTIINTLILAFNNMILINPYLQPMILSLNVPPNITFIHNNYDGINNQIIIDTVGLYDHIGIILNDQDDNSYSQFLPELNTNNTFILPNINPSTNIIIVSLFSINYKKLYTYTQKSSLILINGGNNKTYYITNTNSFTIPSASAIDNYTGEPTTVPITINYKFIF